MTRQFAANFVGPSYRCAGLLMQGPCPMAYKYEVAMFGVAGGKIGYACGKMTVMLSISSNLRIYAAIFWEI